jgi:hypothetical protein
VAERDDAALAIFDTLTDSLPCAASSFSGAACPRRPRLEGPRHTVDQPRDRDHAGVSQQLGRPFLTKRQVNWWKQATISLSSSPVSCAANPRRVGDAGGRRVRVPSTVTVMRSKDSLPYAEESDADLCTPLAPDVR